MHSALPRDALVLTVRAVIPATPTTRILRLDLSRAPFAFQAGQAALIGPAGQDVRIPYSIASAPIEALEHDWLDFLIKVEPSGRWGQQFDAVSPGARIGIEGPYGSFLFPVEPPERHFLFIAGGTGIAPIRAMIQQALLRGQEGRMRLLYSAKTSDDFAYLPELVNMARAEAGNTAPLNELLPDLMAKGMRPVTDNGILGDPRLATAQVGQLLFDELVDRVLEEIANA